MFKEIVESHNIDETAQELFKHNPTTATEYSILRKDYADHRCAKPPARVEVKVNICF